MLPSRILFFSAISFIAGIFLRMHPAILFLLALACLLVLPNKTIALFILVASFGSFWYLFLDSQKMVETDFHQGRVIQEERAGQFVISGGVLLITDKSSDYRVGDILELRGKIKPIDQDDRYLKKERIGLVAVFPAIEVIGHKRSLIDSFRVKSLDFLKSSLSNPQLSIIAAMLLGEKGLISTQWQDKLSSTGTRHITAVSGLHVTIVAAIISGLLSFLGKRKSLFFTLIGIFLFVTMTGLQPSAIRAGIMGAILVIASFLGRMSVSYRSVVLAGAIILLFNPFLLRDDIGFQLSFLAVIGIIYLSPKIKLSFLPKVVRESVVISFSAYIFTLPIIIYYFKELSLVFPITNFLVVPVLYPIMILGALFIFISFISKSLALLALFPLWLLLTYLTAIVDLFSRPGWSSIAVGPYMVAAIIFVILFILFGNEVECSDDKQF